MTDERCVYCGAVRPLRELLRLTRRREPWKTRLVCRPIVSRKSCFTTAGHVDVERVELADPDEQARRMDPAVELRRRHDEHARKAGVEADR